MFNKLFLFTYLLAAHVLVALGGWIDIDTPVDRYNAYSFYDVTDALSEAHKKSGDHHHHYHSGAAATKVTENKKRIFHLVFSDEFNTIARNFSDGQDSRWTSLEKDDYTNAALHYYTSLLVTTSKQNRSAPTYVYNGRNRHNGVLNITTAVLERSFSLKSKRDKSAKGSVTKVYGSGMVQSWNKFCFTGGIVEMKAQLPGYYLTGGLWPAMWLMGNLARATYVGSSENMWPWSSDTCDRKNQKGQLLSACNRVNHFNLAPYHGRGAPEIDIMEAMPGKKELYVTPVNVPYFSSSFQVSPALTQRPWNGAPPPADTWYHTRDMNNVVGLSYGDNTSENVFFYGTYFDRKDGELDRGYQADALSANTGLNETHFDSFHTYRVEWELPGTMRVADNGKNSSGGGGGTETEEVSVESKGYIRWYIDDKFVYGIDGLALNVSGATIPLEPMYLILNTAMSSSWGFPDSKDCPRPRDGSASCFDCRDAQCDCYVPKGLCGNLPASFLIDYVRVYQDTSKGSRHTTGCSPRDFPTADYIKAHESLYKDEEDKTALKPSLVRGGGKCKSDAECNGDSGSATESDIEPTLVREKGVQAAERPHSITRNHCFMSAAAASVSRVNRTGVCRCTTLFTGSHCRAQLGFEAVTYSYSDDDIVFGDLPSVANGLSMGVFVSVAAVSFTMLVAYVYSNPK